MTADRDRLLDAADRASLSGWDFAHVAGRRQGQGAAGRPFVPEAVKPGG